MAMRRLSQAKRLAGLKWAEERDTINVLLATAISEADVPIESSCMCRGVA